MQTGTGVPRSVLRALGERVAGQTETAVAEVVASVERLWPDLFGQGSGLARLLNDVVNETSAAMVQMLITGEPAQLPAASPNAQLYARRFADQGGSAESVGTLFQAIQRVHLRLLTQGLAELVPAADYMAYLPRLVDVILAHGELGYRDAARAFAEVRSWQSQRGAVELSNRLAQVIDGDWSDEAAASRLLNHPMAGLHIGLVIQADDEASLDLRDVQRRLASLPQLRETLVVPLDGATIAVWGKLTEPVDTRAWAAAVSQPLTIRAGIGDIARDLAGFRATHQQARQAFLVANLVPTAHRIAVYQDVAPVAFLAENPSTAQRWVTGVLGELGEPGDDKERLRSTLRHYLEAGENPSAVAERLFVHRNTVGYRINKAVAMLPAGLAGHRLDVALALSYLHWASPE